MSLASLLTWLQGLKSLGLDSRMRRLLASKAWTNTRLVVLLQRAKAIILPAGCRQLFLLHCTQPRAALSGMHPMHIGTEIAVHNSGAVQLMMPLARTTKPTHCWCAIFCALCFWCFWGSGVSGVLVFSKPQTAGRIAHLQTSDTRS